MLWKDFLVCTSFCLTAWRQSCLLGSQTGSCRGHQVPTGRRRCLGYTE